MSRLFVKCVLCPDDKDLLSCVNGNNSNLKAHLESVIIFFLLYFVSSCVDQYILYSQVHKTTFEEIENSFFMTKTHSVSARTAKKLTKSELLYEVLRFIIKENIPVVKVESPHLKRLLGGNFRQNR